MMAHHVLGTMGLGVLEGLCLQSSGGTSVSSGVHWLGLDHNKEPEHSILSPLGNSTFVLHS